MNGRWEKTDTGFGRGRDPLEDPLVTGWDAVVRNTTAPREIDPADTALLRRLHASEPVSLPSPSFFEDLEQQLAGLYAPSVVRASPTPRATSSWTGSVQSSPASPKSISQHSRWFSMQGALAVLSVVVIAGLFVLYRAVPGPSEPPAIPAATIAQPALESMVQLDVTPSLFGMPEASTWTHMYFNLIQLDPGKSFTTDTDWYTSIDGPLLILVLRGELTIHPAGPALFFSAYQRDQTPAEMSPGQSISLGPDAAIVYSAVDSATGSNPGSEPVMALQVSIGHLAFASVGTESAPIDIKNLGNQMDWEMDAPPTTGASISIQRLQLAPFDSSVFDPDPELTYLCVFDQFQMDGVRMADGAMEGLHPDVNMQRLHTSTQLTYPDPGPHTLFNLGEETVDIYFLVVEPAPDAGTP